MRNALERFFDRVNLLNGLLLHLATQLQWFRNSVRTEHEALIPHLTVGARLVIGDLTEWPSHGWAVNYSSGGFATSGEEFLELVDLLTAREACWVVAQAYEALETCLKDLLAAHYLVVPLMADAEELRKQEPNLNRKGLHRGELEFWKTYVRRLYRSAQDILAVVRHIAPQLTDAEQRNNRGQNLVIWFDVILEVRYAVVHSNFTISGGRQGWTPGHEKLAKTLFSGIPGSAGFELRPTVKQVTEALTVLVEYGYAVFKALSIAAGSDWRVFPEQGEK